MTKHFSQDFLSGADAAKGTYEGAPIALTASVQVQANEGADLPTDALRSPEGVAFEIFEVKWHIVAAEQVLGSAIELSLHYRGQPLTNNFVPLWGLAKSEAQRVENQAYETDNIVTRALSVGTWRFDHPVYIDPGETIIPRFKNTGLVTEPITVHMTYTGRVTKKGAPARRWLPYLASYSTPVLDLIGADTATASSSPKDLANKTGNVLHVKRFIGRCATYGSELVADGGDPPAYIPVPRNFESGLSEYTDIGAALALIRMRDSRGYRNVRDYAPFRSVFGAVTRSWECPHDLPAEAYYILDTKVSRIVAGLSGVPADLRTQLSVSMVGWQEVSL